MLLVLLEPRRKSRLFQRGVVRPRAMRRQPDATFPVDRDVRASSTRPLRCWRLVPLAVGGQGHTRFRFSDHFRFFW